MSLSNVASCKCNVVTKFNANPILSISVKMFQSRNLKRVRTRQNRSSNTLSSNFCCVFSKLTNCPKTLLVFGERWILEKLQKTSNNKQTWERNYCRTCATTQYTLTLFFIQKIIASIYLTVVRKIRRILFLERFSAGA